MKQRLQRLKFNWAYTNQSLKLAYANVIVCSLCLNRTETIWFVLSSRSRYRARFTLCSVRLFIVQWHLCLWFGLFGFCLFSMLGPGASIGGMVGTCCSGTNASRYVIALLMIQCRTRHNVYLRVIYLLILQIWYNEIQRSKLNCSISWWNYCSYSTASKKIKCRIWLNKVVYWIRR